MILGGDIGTGYTKAVLFEGGEYVFGTAVPTRADPDSAMENILSVIEEEKGVKYNDIDEIIITGWGEANLSLPHRSAPMMKSLASAAAWDLPSCRNIICMGTQHTTMIALNDKGMVLDYKSNDKCAAGGGAFLEIIFEALECSFDDSEDIARKADKKIQMSSQCAVFAESEVVSLVNDGESVANILDAIYRSLVSNVKTLSRRVKILGDVVVCGGLAKNGIIVELLQEKIGADMHVFQPSSDLIAAIGAALSANGGAK